MTILYLFYHHPLSKLKIQLKSILVDENWKEWNKTFGYSTILLDGFRLNFREDNHCLGISYGTGRINNAKGRSKEATKLKVQRIYDLLLTNEDFSEYPCKEDNCKKYDFAFSNKSKQKEKRKAESSPSLTESERPKKKVEVAKNKRKNRKEILSTQTPPSARLLDIQVDNSAEVEFKKKLKELLFENNSHVLAPEMLRDLREVHETPPSSKNISKLIPNDSIRQLFNKVITSPRISVVLSPEASEDYQVAIGNKNQKKKLKQIT